MHTGFNRAVKTLDQRQIRAADLGELVSRVRLGLRMLDDIVLRLDCDRGAIAAGGEA